MCLNTSPGSLHPASGIARQSQLPPLHLNSVGQANCPTLPWAPRKGDGPLSQHKHLLLGLPEAGGPSPVLMGTQATLLGPWHVHLGHTECSEGVCGGGGKVDTGRDSRDKGRRGRIRRHYSRPGRERPVHQVERRRRAATEPWVLWGRGLRAPHSHGRPGIIKAGLGGLSLDVQLLCRHNLTPGTCGHSVQDQ